MSTPSWDQLRLNESIRQEPIPGNTHLVLWLPGDVVDGVRQWERLSSAPRASIRSDRGCYTVAASSFPAREQKRGLFRKLFHRGEAASQTWSLPGGGSVEQAGERQNDLLLVWTSDPAALPDEAGVRACWPQGGHVRRLGENVYVLGGMAPAATVDAEVLHGCPQEISEKLLAEARAKGDRDREASALADLGILLAQQGDPARGAQLLDQSLTLTRQLGDPRREHDVLGNLGMAVLRTGDMPRALEMFRQELAYARSVGDRFAEKLALEHFGLACSRLRDGQGAIDYFRQALEVARAVGDQKQEGRLLWYLAIQYADLDWRDQAIAQGEEAVAFLEKTGDPQAAWYAHHLENYRQGRPVAAPGVASLEPTLPAGMNADGGFVINAWGAMPSGPVATGPGLLRMALSGAKAAAKFLGSGFKTVSPETHQKRIRTCASCEHHTGVRCRLCGCFTYTKAWLPHENCPIGKWPG